MPLLEKDNNRLVTYMKDLKPLSYDPKFLPRELKPFYISASSKDISEMLNEVHSGSLPELFDSLPEEVKFENFDELPEALTYEALQETIASIAAKNRPCPSFIGDGLPVYREHRIVASILSIRNLTTCYTPYQPEMSQGTLIALWIYQCLMSKLTGFEAINASLYDRSTAIFEAMNCVLRMKKGKADTILISEGILPQDREVVKTLSKGTQLKIVWLPLQEEEGTLAITSVQQKAKELGQKLAGIVFPQVNHWGLVEDVDGLTDCAHAIGAKAVVVIDPMVIARGGLKPPIQMGKKGADIFVAEGQHLAMAPSFGGPGLGIFGMRYNQTNKTDIRYAPGRFVGQTRDVTGKEAFVMVLSTREQHIRKEKATSNICSNQAFLATLAGAVLLAKGEEGMQLSCLSGKKQALKFAQTVTQFPNVFLAFKKSPFFNELTLEVPFSVKSFILEASLNSGLHVGVDVSDRDPKKRNLIKISFSDNQTTEDCERLLQVFEKKLGQKQALKQTIPLVPEILLRKGAVGLPVFSQGKIKTYYQQLGAQNMSPDAGCYPLGSCTMKYNPYINDWAARLEGFTQLHPQVPLEDAQGSLEILYAIQEWFKKITGLASVTSQPVAGAQGELVGLKMFQAYHKAQGQEHRIKIFIPRSAHGTNFATAVMAGYRVEDIIHLEADSNGKIDEVDFQEKLKTYGSQLCGIMVTNPNTSGIFEDKLNRLAEAVHAAGGLVYMDGANMNAIAGWVNLERLGVDAVHNNLHKTWSIPHGGGGPGDAIVAVSSKLADYLPGYQIIKEGNTYKLSKPKRSIGSVHRHWGNFAHKVRCYAYLLRLGREGIQQMSSVAVLSARYLYSKLKEAFILLPKNTSQISRMHEFIISLKEEDFKRLEAVGLTRSAAITSIGKLFLDFGFHAPTVAFPEPLGLMIEPTESYSKKELDALAAAVIKISSIIRTEPHLLKEAPLKTFIRRVDEVYANRCLNLMEADFQLPKLS